MGTRADFYVGCGSGAEWIGSIAWDGYDIPDTILKATSEQEYREAATNFFASRDDATLPEMGWPWPWDTSATTDCHYWYVDGKVLDGSFGDGPAAFPDMSGRKATTLGNRSGLIVVSA